MLKWTGERYIPEMDPGLIHYEHLHRYRFAKEFTKDKTVLDLACGEGYGSFLMAENAKKVVGIDINKGAIEHASLKYFKDNLEFVCGSMTEVLIEDKSFDVIVCFEAIEHIKEHDLLMQEIKRLLKNDGIFIVSTPNTYVYSTQNPFHVKELCYAEFKNLLEKNFNHVSILGQKVYPASNIFPLGEEPARVLEYYIEKNEKDFSFVHGNRKEAVYFVAVASNALTLESRASYLSDISESVFKQKDEAIKFLNEKLINELKIKENIAAKFKEGLKNKEREANILSKKLRSEKINLGIFKKELKEKDAAVDFLKSELADKDSQIISKDQNIFQISRELENIKGSLSWRASQKIGKIFGENRLYLGAILFLRKKIANLGKKQRFKKIEFKKNKNPEVSIIIPVFNNWSYTYNCLLSIKKNIDNVNYEIIVTDDCSTDKTKDIKKFVKNIKVIRNDKNLGFLKNCNNAVNFSNAKFILFLNNDTEVLKDSLFYLLETIKKDNKIGAVGGKIIFPNGLLQEAGSMVFKNGSTKGYGRGDNPSKSEYNFLREVDYCSGAFLLVKKDLFLKFGKFDQIYSPGYYEEVDFCFTLQKNGYKVIYQPLAEIIHYETASMKETAISLQTKNSLTFREKWKNELNGQLDFGNDLVARFSLLSRLKKKILYVDDRVPDSKLGSGYPRTHAILNQFLELNFNITFYPTESSNTDLETLNHFQQKGVEISEDIIQRKNYYNIIFISRPHNMKKMADIVKKHSQKSLLIYDAEAIFAVRDLAYKEIFGEKINSEEKEKKIKEEVELCKDADRVITVSEIEKNIFEKYGTKNCFIISHKSPLQLTQKKFEKRLGLLFVGGILFGGPQNPNLDAMLYFVSKIFPLVRQKIQCNLYIAGHDKSGILKKLKVEGVKWLGCVDNLYEYYNNSKIFIAPTRFSAGIPLKIIEAASFGVPVVAGKITANQLGWQDGVECLVAENPQEFAEKITQLYFDQSLWYKIRNNAGGAVKNKFSPNVFKESLEKALFFQ